MKRRFTNYDRIDVGYGKEMMLYSPISTEPVVREGNPGNIGGAYYCHSTPYDKATRDYRFRQTSREV